jgi:hypothetical protein
VTASVPADQRHALAEIVAVSVCQGSAFLMVGGRFQVAGAKLGQGQIDQLSTADLSAGP